jgi:hypothetical protein
MVTDTKPPSKTCSRCNETKEPGMFIKKRNICKTCANTRKQEIYRTKVIDVESTKECNTCHETKLESSFVKNRNMCSECNCKRRRIKYENDEEHRLILIQRASAFKHNKVVERQKAKLEEIGEGNKKCSNCSEIKPECNFRYNRLKCRTCERDDPIEKFKRIVRGRIHSALYRGKGKSKNTIKYLGACSKDYLEWILHNDKNYTLENRGKVWHIDHVIPVSLFDLDDEEQQTIAFNWRNTMPLDAKENLQKHNRISKLQIEQHYKHLSDYHKEKNIEFPQVFIDLFAKHLVAGTPLEPSLPS